MPETSLALPLSGQEVKKAILDRIEQALDRDCYLHPQSSYDFYEASIAIYLRLSDAGNENVVTVDETLTQGVVGGEVEESEVALDIEKKPPNQERIETGQPVPTLSKDASGKPEVKHIKYARKRATEVKP